MQLALNPAHPLCQPSRNLLFATFGTGHGGQVLDLADRPSHGMMTHASTRPTIHRSLQSQQIPGLPSDVSALTFRENLNAAVDFGNSTKVTGLTDNFTVAFWVKPYQVDGAYTIPFMIGPHGAGGSSGGIAIWGTSLNSGDAPNNVWMVFTASGVTRSVTYASNVLLVNQWNLVGVSYSTSRSPRFQLFQNGAPTAIAYSDVGSPVIGAGSTFRIGANEDGNIYPARADIGPVNIWGSVLSANDIALLYRDTWGMVTRGTPLALRMAASSQTTSVSGHRLRTLLGVG